MASFGTGYSAPASSLFRRAERYCARFTDFIVTVGEELRRTYLAAGIGSENQYWVIPSPLELDRFLAVRQMPAAEMRRVRAKYAIAGNVQIIIAAGLLERRKRFDLIIEKLAPLLQTRRFILVVAGEGPERQRLTTLAARLQVSGQVRFVGYVDSLPELFGCSAILVHSSRVEGMPQVVVQAAAAGLPVVASSVHGLSDLPPGAVRVFDNQGLGLLAACREILASEARDQVPLEVLQTWRIAHIESQQVCFHEAVARLIRHRPGGTR
jgi:glycosyltransferase involved in cell wall biosynthesis